MKYITKGTKEHFAMVAKHGWRGVRNTYDVRPVVPDTAEQETESKPVEEGVKRGTSK